MIFQEQKWVAPEPKTRAMDEPFPLFPTFLDLGDLRLYTNMFLPHGMKMFARYSILSA